MEYAVEFRQVSRVYKTGDHEQRALDGVDLALEGGKLIVKNAQDAVLEVFEITGFNDILTLEHD